MRHDKKRCINEKLQGAHAHLGAHFMGHTKLLLAAAAGAALLLVLGQVASAGPQPADPETVANAWVEALNEGDADGATNLYAEDAVILFLNKEIKGRPPIAERQRTTITQTLKPSLKVEDISVQGDTVKVSLLGENGITRFDGHAPVRAVTTLTVLDGKIVKEVGPVLGQADAAWYAATSPRFLQSQGQPSRLPQTGEQAETSQANWVVGTLGLGVLFVSAGVALRVLRPRVLRDVPRKGN